MKNLIDSKLFWFSLTLGVSMLFMLVFSKEISNEIVKKHYNQIADEVVKKLQKEYSPSPYGPGIDPDKIDLEKLK